jgi:transposase-like protein
MESTDQVLKQDAAGRVWTPRERREALLDEFERGGLPATKFAAEIGVKYQTFANWVQKRRKERSAGSATQGPVPVVCRSRGWVEATVGNVEAERSRTLVVHLPGGARVEIADAAQAVLAAHMLRALGGGVVC